MDTHNGSTRFHISCQSLDRIWAVFRPSDYADKGAPEPVQGHVLAGGFVCSTSNFSTGAAVEVGLPEYDRGGVPGISDEKYVSKYHDCRIESDATIQLQLNGSRLRLVFLRLSQSGLRLSQCGGADSWRRNPRSSFGSISQ